MGLVKLFFGLLNFAGGACFSVVIYGHGVLYALPAAGRGERARMPGAGWDPPSSFRRRPESSGLIRHSRKAGMTTPGRPRNPAPAKSGNYRLPRLWTVRSIQACRDNAGAVMPAQAGMSWLNHWMPACAGMTGGG